MTLKKGFLRPVKLPDRYTLINGIILGNCSAIVLFGLFYFFREALRFYTGFIAHSYLILLSKRELFLYNLFYGSIAAVLGFYIFVKFTTENSIDHQNYRFRIKQRYLLNEVGFFGWSFLSLLARVGTVIGIWFATIPMQYDIVFIDEKPIVFVLIPIVLFLNLWPTLLRMYGRRVYRWLAVATINISILSFLFANFNHVDITRFEDVVKRKSVELTHGIDPPRSVHFNRFWQQNVINIYVLYDSSEQFLPAYFWNTPNTPFQLRDLHKLIKRSEKEAVNYSYRTVVNLTIDKSVPLFYVNDLKEELRKNGIEKINYSTARKYSKYPSDYPEFKNCGIQLRIWPPYSQEFKNLLDSLESIDLHGYRIKTPESWLYRVNNLNDANRVALHVGQDKVTLNQVEIEKERLEQFLLSFFRKYSPDALVIYTQDENITYERYIEYLDLIYITIDKLRNEYSMEKFGYSFQGNSWQNGYNDIRSKYPRNIAEWSREEKRLLKLINKKKTDDNF